MPATLQQIFSLLLIILVILSPGVIAARPALQQINLSTVNIEQHGDHPNSVPGDPKNKTRARPGPKPKALLNRSYNPRGPIKQVCNFCSKEKALNANKPTRSGACTAKKKK